MRAILYLLLVAYSWLIIARGLLSWVRPRYGSGLYRLEAALVTLTEPYLGFFRRRLRPVTVGSASIDWSFLVALLVLWGVIWLITLL